MLPDKFYMRSGEFTQMMQSHHIEGAYIWSPNDALYRILMVPKEALHFIELQHDYEKRDTAIKLDREWDFTKHSDGPSR